MTFDTDPVTTIEVSNYEEVIAAMERVDPDRGRFIIRALQPIEMPGHAVLVGSDNVTFQGPGATQDGGWLYTMEPTQ
mgnify:CR=1 FL=1